MAQVRFQQIDQVWIVELVIVGDAQVDDLLADERIGKFLAETSVPPRGCLSVCPFCEVTFLPHVIGAIRLYYICMLVLFRHGLGKLRHLFRNRFG